MQHKTRHGLIVTSNTSTPIGNDRYQFELQVQPERQDDVARVEYILHETFPNPVQERRDPSDGFALRANGWGEFDVGVRIEFKDGSVERLHHPLKLFGRG